MSGYIHQKSFLDYPSQINLLKQKQLTIRNETIATNILKKISYYSLINGYKELFKDSSTNNYYPGTSFDDIHQLYLFDAELREIFLKYILIFEKHIKSSISYHFSNTYGNGIAAYQDFRYQHGKSDLFATVISLKYLLEPADFRLFYYELKKTIKKYSLSDKVLSAMGFPPNWMSI